MAIFKSSSPKDWSLGLLLLFQQLFPVWDFVCFLKIFFSCQCVQEAIWKAFCTYLDSGALEKWRGQRCSLGRCPPTSCFQEAAGSRGTRVSYQEAVPELPVGIALWRSNCHLPAPSPVPSLVLLSDSSGACTSQDWPVAPVRGRWPSVASAVSESCHRLH